MPEVSIRENLRDHAENIVGLFKDEVGILREAWNDVKGRIGRDTREPSMGKKYGVPGITGGLSSTIVALPIATMDNVEHHSQEFGKIIRRWVK